MRFTAMAYNIMRIFEEESKAKIPERIHPSDKKITNLSKKDRIFPRKKAALLTHYFFMSALRV
ncbi:MAG: hypothetical protein ACJA0N_000580 [Pseudohongiellaceae bacterium]|jgi:hypothetical protein